MSLHDELETSLLSLLRNDKQLSVVKAFEAEIKDALFVGEKLSQGFRDGQLPAINLSVSIAGTRGNQFTAGEIRYEVPVSIAVITRALKPNDARKQAVLLGFTVLQILQPLRRSGNVLGRNIILVNDVTSSPASVVHEQPNNYAWVTIDATIQSIQASI